MFCSRGCQCGLYHKYQLPSFKSGLSTSCFVEYLRSEPPLWTSIYCWLMKTSTTKKHINNQETHIAFSSSVCEILDETVVLVSPSVRNAVLTSDATVRWYVRESVEDSMNDLARWQTLCGAMGTNLRGDQLLAQVHTTSRIVHVCSFEM